MLGILNGRFVEIEVKRDAESKPTAIQRYIHERIRDAGGTVIVAWNFEMITEDLFNDAECTRTDAELVVHKELTEARALLNALAENHKMTITELHRAFLQESN